MPLNSEPPVESLTETRRTRHFVNGEVREEDCQVALETPLTIMLNGEELATLVCSPHARKELVLGFLAGEGLIRSAADVKDYFHREKQEVVWVETQAEATACREGFLRRNFTSCCGKGRPSLYFRNDSEQLTPLAGTASFTAPHLLDLMARLEEGSHTFQVTGGVHAAALADDREILARFEDIGRHNALDRILGHVLLHGLETSDKAILLSGRTSSEMLIKAARIGAPVLVSRSAPTALAVDLAEQLNVTLVGFARGRSLFVYCCDERIRF